MINFCWSQINHKIGNTCRCHVTLNLRWMNFTSQLPKMCSNNSFSRKKRFFLYKWQKVNRQMQGQQSSYGQLVINKNIHIMWWTFSSCWMKPTVCAAGWFSGHARSKEYYTEAWTANCEASPSSAIEQKLLQFQRLPTGLQFLPHNQCCFHNWNIPSQGALQI